MSSLWLLAELMFKDTGIYIQHPSIIRKDP